MSIRFSFHPQPLFQGSSRHRVTSMLSTASRSCHVSLLMGLLCTTGCGDLGVSSEQHKNKGHSVRQGELSSELSESESRDEVKDNEAPVADAGADQEETSYYDDASESIVLDASGSFDPDGDIVSYTWVNASGETIATGREAEVHLPVGTHEITLLVVDDQGAESSDQVTVTVDFMVRRDAGAEIADEVQDREEQDREERDREERDREENQLPVADAGDDLEGTTYYDDATELIILSAAESFDPDGDLVSYTWSNQAGDVLAMGREAEVRLPVGAHEIKLSVVDDQGAESSDIIMVIIDFMVQRNEQ